MNEDRGSLSSHLRRADASKSFLQVFLFFRVTGETQFIAFDGEIDLSFRSILFVLMARLAAFGGSVHHSMFYQFAVTVGAFGLANFFVVGSRHRDTAQPGFASCWVGAGTHACPHQC